MCISGETRVRLDHHLEVYAWSRARSIVQDANGGEDTVLDRGLERELTSGYLRRPQAQAVLVASIWPRLMSSRYVWATRYGGILCAYTRLALLTDSGRGMVWGAETVVAIKVHGRV